MTEAVEAPVEAGKTRPARSKFDRAELEKRLIAANERARVEFVDKYEGAALGLPTKLGNRPVVKQFLKCFDISMRNWHVATSVPRSALGDATLANSAELAMLQTIKRVHDEFAQMVRGLKALAEQDPDCDLTAIIHSNPFNKTVRVIGPVGMQLRALFILSDQLCDYATALHAFSGITSEEHSKIMYDVKNKLRRVASAIKDQRVRVLNKCNELGKSRPNYMKVEVTDSTDAILDIDDSSEAKPDASATLALAA